MLLEKHLMLFQYILVSKRSITKIKSNYFLINLILMNFQLMTKGYLKVKGKSLRLVYIQNIQHVLQFSVLVVIDKKVNVKSEIQGAFWT